MLATHEGTPPVLRDIAPGLPKQGPPWDIEGEPGGPKKFALKRPFEANNKGDATGHLGHHKRPLVTPKNHISTSNIKSPHTSDSYLLPQHSIEAICHLCLEAHQEGMRIELEEKVAMQPP